MHRLGFFRRGTKDTKGTVQLINPKQTDNTMAKRKTYKQAVFLATKQRSLNTYKSRI